MSILSTCRYWQNFGHQDLGLGHLSITGMLKLAGSPHYEMGNGVVVRQTYVHYNVAHAEAIELKVF